MLFSHLTYLVLQHCLAKEETLKTAHWCFMHATQSNCCSTLYFLFLEPCPPKSPKLNALVQDFSESYSSVSMSRESKRLKRSSSNCLNGRPMDVAENLGSFRVRSVQARGIGKMETEHPVEGSSPFGNEFPSICNHCGVMAA